MSRAGERADGRSTRRSTRRSAERGAAVVDFALVSILVLFLFLGVLQIAFALHVRNTLIACASEGARYGARAGSSPALGAERARTLVTAELSARFASDVTASVTTVAGARAVAVEMRAPLPVLGPFGPSGALDVTGHAFLEGQ